MGSEGSSASALFLRAIISTKMVGAVIGRGGSTVSTIRDETATKVTISEPVQGSSERILTISGPLEGVAKAFSMISVKIDESNVSSSVALDPNWAAWMAHITPPLVLG